MLAQITWFPHDASTMAGRVDWFFIFLLVITGAMGLLVAVLLIGFAVHFRRREGQGPPPYTHPNLALEVFWTLTPLGIFMVMFVWGATLYFEAYRAPDDATVVYGIGKQWMWKFQHPEGQREINQLHVPTGRPFKMMLTSEDVIHSFFVPDFRIHQDVLPNRYTSVWFQATRPGTYHLFCSQYCGTWHSGMVGEVIVMEPAEYQNWLNEHAEGSLALEGAKVFRKYRCISCHSADQNARAPVLEELYGAPVHLTDGRVVVADEQYIRESIYEPSAKIVAGWQNIMPTFKGQVSEEEIIQLIAFIKSLEKGQTPRRVEEYPPPTSTPPINPLTEKP
ncbi:MAG: cytochrome c oxidase subunit II [Planctomycetes bacterium]|nr:cytochrome c oxidase subunit II [Planctomycetota bacterium]